MLFCQITIEKWSKNKPKKKWR